MPLPKIRNEFKKGLIGTTDMTPNHLFLFKSLSLHALKENATSSVRFEFISECSLDMYKACSY